MTSSSDAASRASDGPLGRWRERRRRRPPTPPIGIRDKDLAFRIFESMRTSYVERMKGEVRVDER